MNSFIHKSNNNATQVESHISSSYLKHLNKKEVMITHVHENYAINNSYLSK